MSKISPLPVQKLAAKFPAERIPHASSAEIPKTGQRRPAQPRALKALELALHIKNNGYNIYLSGEADSGRLYLLNEFLGPKAKKTSTPPDLLYVHNFADSDKPKLLTLPAGQGAKFKKALSESLFKARKEIISRMEKEPFEKMRNGLYDTFQNKREKLVRRMDAVAGGQGFNLDLDEQGSMTLYPLVEGKRLSPQDFENLDFGLRKDIRQRGANLTKSFGGMIRELSKVEQNLFEDERKLEREQATQVLEGKLAALAKKFGSPLPPTAGKSGSAKTQAPAGVQDVPVNRDLGNYLEALKKDLLDNLEHFLLRELSPQGFAQPQGAPQQMGPPFPLPEHQIDLTDPRYEVNLFVDNSGLQGAPIIHDDHPTLSNLLGCIERESEMGALITDFSLIKSGSLHRANGGFLIIHLNDLLQATSAYEGLLRALRSGLARIEDPGDGHETTKTKGLVPEPLKLSLKVIFIGTEEMYEQLLMLDDRFSKLFKIKAHLTEQTDRNADGMRVYLSAIRKIIDESNLMHFDRAALAGLIDLGSRLHEDQKKLSLKFPLLREFMIEASALASMRGKTFVDAASLEEAISASHYRNNLYEEAFLEDYDRKLIKVVTTGSAIGRVNGLSVTMYGDFEFGLPHQIACTVGVGHGGIIDLEREAELSGPIHTKAMLIIKSYLLAMFARKKPIILTGSLCFEQSYAGIEGDSASGAELAALLSAIAEVPINLALAFTGAVNQAGQIMAVGGVTRKIEGFFQVCRHRGLTGEQGVILPYDNIDHLMLNKDVINAVQEGRFNIYPVSHIDEALELLTGLPAGKMRKDGSFSRGSLYRIVDMKLTEMARQASKFKKAERGRNRP